MNPGQRIEIYKSYLHLSNELIDRGTFQEHGEFSCVYLSDDGEYKRAEINRMAKEEYLHKDVEQHKKILRHFGSQIQVMKFVEELNEAASCLTKWCYLQADLKTHNIETWDENRANIDLELSDIRNMLPVIDMIFAPKPEIQEKQFKRTLERVE